MTRFLDEVNEQPGALLNLVFFYRAQGEGLLDEWRKLLEKYERIVFCGMGTSEHAAYLIRYDLHARGKVVSIYDAGEYLHYLTDNVDTSALYVLISQSGESAETKKVAESLAGRADTVVLANNETSAMARLADLFLPIKGGEEVSVTNKTYLNTLALLYLMAGGRISKLEEVADGLKSTFKEDEVVRAAEFIGPAGSIHFIARGPALAAARQMALTFMEGAKTHAAAFTGGAFRHGPFEVLGEDHRAVILAPRGKTSHLCLSMAGEMAAAGSRVVLLTDLDQTPENKNVFTIRVRSFSEEKLFPLALAMVQNYLLHHMARLRGYEAGVFIRSTKVTTVEQGKAFPCKHSES